MKVIPFISLILYCILASCSYHSDTKLNSEIPYQEFRKQQKSYASPEGSIKYIDQGEGKVIVLLHGVPSSGWLYRKMIGGLTQAGYRVIVPDMLGYGASASPDGYEIYSARQQSNRLLGLMDSLKIKHWTHVFHDVGGTWTWEMMKSQPERVNQLVMLNSITLDEGFKPPVRMNKGLVAKTAMHAYSNGLTTDLMLNGLFKEGLKNSKLLSVSDRFGYKKPLLEGKTKGMYYFFTQTCKYSPDYSDVVATLKVPTIVIWGKHDKMLRWSPQAPELSSKLKIKPSNIHLIDAKHFIQEEQPDLINQIILKSLR